MFLVILLFSILSLWEAIFYSYPFVLVYIFWTWPIRFGTRLNFYCRKFCKQRTFLVRFYPILNITVHFWPVNIISHILHVGYSRVSTVLNCFSTWVNNRYILKSAFHKIVVTLYVFFFFVRIFKWFIKISSFCNYHLILFTETGNVLIVFHQIFYLFINFWGKQCIFCWFLKIWYKSKKIIAMSHFLQ